MNWLIVVHAFLMLCIAMWVIRGKTSASRWTYWIAFAFRMFCGLAVGWLYMNYYGHGDTLVFLHDAKVFSALAREDFGLYLSSVFTGNTSAFGNDLNLLNDPRSLLFVRLVSPLAIISLDNYWVIASWCSLVSFAGSWFLFATATKYFPLHKSAAAAAFLFFPSIIFWTSGLIKESVACGCLFFLSAVFLRLWFDRRVQLAQGVGALLALWLLWNLKYYYAGIFLPVAVSLTVFRFFVEKKVGKLWLQASIWCAMLVVLMAGATFLHPNFRFSAIIDVMVSNYEAYQQYSAPGDAIVYESFDRGLWSVLANSPKAIFSALFRPFVIEASGEFQLFAAIENFLLLIFAAAGTLTALRGRISREHAMLVFGALAYILLLADFLALSAPNFGTLSRYRVGFLPFFAFLIFCGSPIINSLVGRIRDLVPF
jgi:hypothetical protein